MMKRLLYIFLFVFHYIAVKAQVYPHPSEDYEFILYNQNRLTFPGDSTDFQHFYQKLDDLIFKGTGKINIVHIGGSHVQADIFSGQLRERLSEFFPGNKGSRGLIFPFTVAETNNPYNYYVTYTGTWQNCRNTKKDFTCPLGLTGMAVYTTDSTSSIQVTLKQENYPAYDFNLIRVFVAPGTANYRFDISGMDTSLYTTTLDTTAGIAEIHLSTYENSVNLVFSRTDSLASTFMLLGIQLENSDPGITYHAIGVNGASTNSFLRCNLLEDHLRVVQPDLVIFALGINDASGSGFESSYFEYNYNKLIEKVKAAAPGCAILFITNNDSFKKYRRRYYVNNNGPIVRQSMLNLAAQNGTGVWDLFTIMGGLSSMKTWEVNDLSKKDKVHFTTAGYKLIGDLMFSAIIRSYEYYLKNTYSEK